MSKTTPLAIEEFTYKVDPSNPQIVFVKDKSGKDIVSITINKGVSKTGLKLHITHLNTFYSDLAQIKIQQTVVIPIYKEFK